MLSDIAQTAVGVLFDILDILISLLPAAPFRALLSDLAESSGMDVLGYVNYFIPFKFCATCMNAWLACVLAYYVYKYLKEVISQYRLKS